MGQQKFTEQLSKLIAATSGDDALEVVVLLQSSSERAKPSGADVWDGALAQEAKRESEARIGDFLKFVRFLEADGEAVTVLDTSWLANSVLMLAPAATLQALARCEEVALIDVNAQVGQAEVLDRKSLSS